MIQKDPKNNKTRSSLTSYLRDAVFEYEVLRKQLYEATEKQHQEMTRAIQLKLKNFKLTEELNAALKEISKLQDLREELMQLRENVL